MDKKYKIMIRYETGDSFGSHSEEDSVELTWDDLSIAKINLCRIKEHYEWYKSQHQYYYRKDEQKVPKPKWLPKVWKYDFCLPLKTDSGNDYQLSAFWCGHFEQLYGASIETLKDPEMSFDI